MTIRGVEEEEELHEIEVTMDTAYTFDADSRDPFEKAVDGTYGSLGATTKKRITRTKNTFEKRFQSEDGEAGSKQIDDFIITGYNAYEVVVPPYNLGYLAKLYEISAAHMAAVDAKVANTVGLGYDFVETDDTKKEMEKTKSAQRLKQLRKRVEDEKQRLRELLDSFNEEDLFMETLIKVVTDLETTGNGYFEVGRTVEGEIHYFGHIPSESMRVRRERDGFVQIIGNKAVFFRNFGDTETPNPLNNDPNPNEVIHLKIYSPTNGYYGVPKVVSSKTALAGNEFAAKYNLDYFENKAVPRYIIVTKGSELSATSKDQLFEFFTSGLKGVNHRTLYIPLPADNPEKKVDFQMEPIEAGIQDASFVNYRKVNLADVLMSHRVPITKVSTAEGTNLGVARDADKTFKEQVTRPAQSIIEKKLNKLIGSLTTVVKLKLNELALSDEDAQSKIDEVYLRMQVITPNEVRARKGLPSIEGGDKVVELKPQQAADQRATAGKTRARDAERSAGRTDSRGESRNPKGEGRVVKIEKAIQPNFSNDVMVALKIDDEVAERIALPDGLPPEDLHITLAYLGDVMDQELGPNALARVVSEMFFGPLSGVIAGKGLFVNEGETVTYLSPDIPGLPDLRQSLVNELKAWGVQVAENHGFTPHITLIYGDRLSQVVVDNIDLYFDSVSIYWGNMRIDVPLVDYAEPVEEIGMVD